MAALSTAARQLIRREWSSDLSRRGDAFSLSRAQLDAAIAATDDWIELNAAAFNLALPVVARSNLTVAQKAELFMHVARARFLAG